jgi:Cyanate permease
MFYGALSLVLIPFVAKFFVLSPQLKGVERIGDNPEDASKQVAVSGMTSGEALKTGVFWLAFIIMALLAGSAQSWNGNGAAYLTDLNYDPIRMASILSITALGITIGKPLLGAICDKFGTKVGTVYSGLILIVSYSMMIMVSKNASLIIPAAIVMGLSICTINILLPLIANDMFGNRDYATLTGFLQVSMSLGGSIFPLIMTLIYDRSGSYTSAWTVMIGVAVAIIIFGLLIYKLRDNMSKAA